MRYEYILGFHSEKKEERVESNFLPDFIRDPRTGDIYFRIIGRECAMLYYPSEVYIKCIYEAI